MANKYFKATLTPKKSHPNSPAEIVTYSDAFKTQKEFSDQCLKELAEVENVSLWFAPKIEKVTQEEFELNNDNKPELETEEFQSSVEPLPTSSALLEQYHFFEYAKGYPIIVKLNKLSGKVRASYMFDSDQFLKIDKEFNSLENALVNALGYVLSDCTDAGVDEHAWAKATVKGIGGRDPERFFHESIMTQEDLVNFFDAEPSEIVDTWEANDDIKYKKLYSKIVDIISVWKGDEIPSAGKCYAHLVASIPAKYANVDNVEARILREIAEVKNPYNLTNSANATQIMMCAFRDLDSAERLKVASKTEAKQETEQKPESAMFRLADKFSETKDPETLPATTKNEPLDTKSAPEVVKNEPETGESLPTDFEIMVNDYNEKIESLDLGEVIIFDDMPNEVYHAVVGVSSSKIKDAMRSLMYYNAKHNTKEIEPETGEQFDVGNVFHSVVLEPDMTSKEYIGEPSGDDIPKKPTEPQWEKFNAWHALGCPEKADNPKAYPTDLMLERCGFWKDFHEENASLYPVDADNWKLAQNMAVSALTDSDSSLLLKHPMRKTERSYFKRCEITGMIIKARPDIEVGKIIGDLKSIALRGNFDEKYLITALRKEIYNRNYHLSAAMYLDICGKDRFVWIFTNKQKGYHWTATIRASEKILGEGMDLYIEYKQKIADAYNSGNWSKPESIQSRVNPESGKIELPEV